MTKFCQKQFSCIQHYMLKKNLHSHEFLITLITIILLKFFFLEKPAIAAKPSKVKKDERPVCMILQYVIIFFDAMEHMFKTNF